MLTCFAFKYRFSEICSFLLLRLPFTKHFYYFWKSSWVYLIHILLITFGEHSGENIPLEIIHIPLICYSKDRTRYQYIYRHIQNWLEVTLDNQYVQILQLREHIGTSNNVHQVPRWVFHYIYIYYIHAYTYIYVYIDIIFYIYNIIYVF